jgi:serine phosphatase RsbU (regulator of sigma subunit)/putative methionine-R-sulfoxide reductase with GAF domain
MPASNLANNSNWKQFILLGEDLLKHPSTAEQCKIITDAVQNRLDANARIWLEQPFYPLPGEPELECQISIHASELVKLASKHEAPFGLTLNQTEPQPLDHNQKNTAIAFPLITQDTLLGVVEIWREEGATPFTQSDLETIERLSRHSAVAMQVTRNAAIKNWRFEQLNLVRSVSAQIANLLDLDELCTRITSLIQNTFNYYLVSLFTIEPDKEFLEFRAFASLQPLCDSEQLLLHAIRLGDGMVGHVARHGREHYAPDVDQDQLYRPANCLPDTQSEITIPIKVENRVLGVLDVQSDRKNGFHEMDRLVLRSLADNIALAVEGTHLYQDLQHRFDQLTAVVEVSTALSSVLERDELPKKVAELIQKHFGFPYIHIFSVHNGRRLVIYRTGTGQRSELMQQNETTYPLDSQNGIIPWVAREGKPILLNDVTSDPRYRPLEHIPDNTRSEMTLPLLYGEEVLGILDIQSDKLNAFNERDLPVFEALAASIATALRNASLYVGEQWRRQVADSFRDVAGLLSSNTELDQLLQTILEELERNLPCEASAIWLYDQVTENVRTLRLAAAKNIDTEYINRIIEQSSEASLWMKTATQENEPTIRHPNDPYGPIGIANEYPKDYSSIAAPLHIGKQPLGLLSLAHPTPGRYGGEALSMVSTFASYAAVAIQNQRLYAASQEQAWLSTVMLQVAEACQAATSVDDLLATTTRLTPLLVGVRQCAFFLWDKSLMAFVLKSDYGLEDQYFPGTLFESTTPSFQKLREINAPVFIDNPADDINMPLIEYDPSCDTILMLPLQVRDEVLGAYLIVHRDSSVTGVKRAFNSQTYSILKGISRQTSTALENLLLLENRQEESYITAVMLQVAQAVASQNDLEEILDTIVHLMPILVGIDACAIYLKDEFSTGFYPAKAYASDNSLETNLNQSTFRQGRFPLLDQAHATGQVLAAPLPSKSQNLQSWAATPAQPLQDQKDEINRSTSAWLIGCPLGMKGISFGVFLAKDTGAAPAFRERRFELIQGVAQQIAIAIQNDHLTKETLERERMKQEFQLARQIQESFLPTFIPEFKGWELDSRWQTARQVGGDFYDVFNLPDGRLGLTIADVSDKGLGAALYMTVARTLIRANALNESSPARVLEKVNNLLLLDSQNGMFVTAIYAILDPTSGELVLSNAGHNLPLIIRANSPTVEVLPKGNLALGVLENTKEENLLLKLNTGDCLVLYTDGVTEAFSAENKQFGIENLCQVLTYSVGRSASQVLHLIDQALEDFRQGQPPSDDITLLALRRKP